MKLTVSLDSVLGSIDGDVYVIDREFRLCWVSAGLKKMTPGPETLHSLCYSTLWGNKRPCENCPASKAVRSRQMERAEVSLGANGKSRVLNVTSAALKPNSKTVQYTVQTIRDITDAKKNQKELAQLSALYKAIVEHAPIAISTVDKNGVFTSLNPAMAKSMGISEDEARRIIGFRWLENPYTIKSGLIDHIKRGLEGESISVKEFPFISYRGDKNIFLDFQIIPMKARNNRGDGLLVIVEETTEKVNTRARLIEETRMATIAKLAMGVAHGLNNPLASIAAYCDLTAQALRSFNRDSVASQGLEEIEDFMRVIDHEAFRCKQIINSLFKLGSNRNIENEDIDLAMVVDEILALMNIDMKKIIVDKHFPKSLPYVYGDLSMVKQVLWNIITNAIDALEHRNNGKIRLTAKRHSGQHVLLTIADNGPGIPESVVNRIFQPFFTTKPADKGTGLGLSLARDFIEKMNGHIEVHSKKSKGTTFRVVLPILNQKTSIKEEA